MKDLDAATINLTPIINSAICQQCAECCKTLFFGLPLTEEVESFLHRYANSSATTAEEFINELFLYSADSDGQHKRLRLLALEKTPDNYLSFERKFSPRLRRDIFMIKLIIPCSALENSDDGYLCSLWQDASRPELCAKFPAGMFMGAETDSLISDTTALAAVAAYIAPFCPPIKSTGPETVAELLVTGII